MMLRQHFCPQIATLFRQQPCPNTIGSGIVTDREKSWGNYFLHRYSYHCHHRDWWSLKTVTDGEPLLESLERRWSSHCGCRG
eukprot:3837812-Amphidinium_carterae.1